MLASKAIGQGLSIAIVIVIILAAFLGYAVGATISQQRTSTYIVTTYSLKATTITASQTISVTVTAYCCTDSNLSLSTPCSTIVTPDYPPVQRLQYLVDTDPEFIAAEHGLNYTTYFNGCGSVYSIGGNVPNGTYVYFQSTYTTDEPYTNDCGNVGNFTYYLNVAVPLTETGYNMSAIRISPTSSSEITVTCTTTT
ncbi:MAG TPA: hypothetical protein VFF30_01825 [Nitrososphaerales archaeon]|nr:hypothetical protein [Nitrososphaerales archaeon]